jgi:hypothetical protein
MPVKNDMTLHVGVRITGSVDAANHPAVTAVYDQLGSSPPSNGVVAANGDIDLNRMEFEGRRFNRQTDITFTLSGEVHGPGGRPLEFRFPADPDEAIAVKYKGKRTREGMTPRAGANAMSVVLDDEDRESRTYEYCLNVLVATAGPAVGDHVTCVLDPLIVNREQ